jgi:Ca2+-binding RTX toxin-like protein
MSCLVQSLEARRLCSTSLLNRVLTIDGTHRGDRIDCSASARRIYVRVNGQTASFALGEVSQIRVFAYRGNDVVNLGAIVLPCTLIGAAGDDQLIGGAGDDVLDGGSGSDLLGGGIAGIDCADYSQRTERLTLSIGGGRNDGAAGEDDSIAADVEILLAGSGNDRLLGSQAANFLSGGRGSDRIEGRGGNDTLSGGPGNDTLLAGAGSNAISGGPGDDLLDAHNGSTRDEVSGGAGRDFATIDLILSGHSDYYTRARADSESSVEDIQYA